jgi:predicted GNAT family acetyltransferase
MEEIIELEFDDKNGCFYILIDGKQEAKMTFVFAGPNKIIIDHTEVNEGNNGKGFGQKMVVEAVTYAREKNIKVIPLCPFAKKVFEKNPEFNDVLQF